jgi:hypothetical protein
MKKALITTVFALTFFAASAQDLKDELALTKALFGKESKEIVAEFIKIDQGREKQFWALFDEFEAKRSTNGQKKFVLLNKYVKNYMTLSEVETDEIIKEIILLTKTQENLIANYFKKIRKSCGVYTAAQFYQIEWYLTSEVRTNILESIPVIKELEIMKK